MRRRINTGLIVGLMVALVWPAAPGGVFPAEAAVANWQKSVSIQPRWDGDFGTDTFRQSVAAAKTMNANMVTLIIPYYQSNIYSTDLARGWNTPTDESLISAIQYIHSLGLQVALKIHPESNDGQWRAMINPSNRDGWFAVYGNILNHYADIAQAHGVELFILGS